MSDGGKGSSPRPFGVNRKTYEDNWERIFGNKSKNERQQIDAEQPTAYNNNTNSRDQK